MKNIKGKVAEVATEICQELGYELVDVEFKKGAKHNLISIFIYKEDGIGLDDCESVSRKIDEILDKDEDLTDPYYLEVSSPGLDRPIKTKDDYRRNLGKEVEVKLYAPIDGKKHFEGFLTSYDDENVLIKIDDAEMTFKQKDISMMRQVIKF